MVHVVLTSKPLVLAFLLAAPLMALDPHTKITEIVHTKWSGADVPFGWATDLAQTNDGRLWVATDQALCRFDGVRFTFLATHDGSLWVVFDSARVSRLLEGNITTFPLEELPQASMLAEDREGNLWLGGDTTLRRWNPRSHNVHQPQTGNKNRKAFARSHVRPMGPSGLGSQPRVQVLGCNDSMKWEDGRLNRYPETRWALRAIASRGSGSHHFER
jgi:ligand-binding sensor domain-containing protein